jgi:hypothetical protein
MIDNQLHHGPMGHVDDGNRDLCHTPFCMSIVEAEARWRQVSRGVLSRIKVQVFPDRLPEPDHKTLQLPHGPQTSMVLTCLDNNTQASVEWETHELLLAGETDSVYDPT